MAVTSDSKIGLQRLDLRQVHFVQELRLHRTDRQEMSETAATAHIGVAKQQASPGRWAAAACAASVLFTVAGIVAVCLLPASDDVKIVAVLAVAVAGGGTAVFTLHKAIDKML